MLAEARLARGYSLGDVAETTGLTVAEVTALENDADFDASRIRRTASVLGVNAGRIFPKSAEVKFPSYADEDGREK
ncbi:helix-turn-helix domain-containing protein [Rhizobium leguminosarum]|uniref:helix-turn-helix domain-containing protein n=1 Tax=Rhizobium leguminosarum TaxID=384 RepID=UPI001FDAB3A6|nr:helix-turn-helix domain-containing protein [Rhizobium leguminosarum]